jgi:hypothetical protein
MNILAIFLERNHISPLKHIAIRRSVLLRLLPKDEKVSSIKLKGAIKMLQKLNSVKPQRINRVNTDQVEQIMSKSLLSKQRYNR